MPFVRNRANPGWRRRARRATASPAPAARRVGRDRQDAASPGPRQSSGAGGWENRGSRGNCSRPDRRNQRHSSRSLRAWRLCSGDKRGPPPPAGAGTGREQGPRNQSRQCQPRQSKPARWQADWFEKLTWETDLGNAAGVDCARPTIESIISTSCRGVDLDGCGCVPAGRQVCQNYPHYRLRGNFFAYTFLRIADACREAPQANYFGSQAIPSPKVTIPR